MGEWRRPGSVVREGLGGRWSAWRQVQGWRSKLIGETLDQCANLPFGRALYVESVADVDARDLTQYRRAWAAANREKARANSRVQTAKQAVLQRQAWTVYVESLAVSVPGSTPIGFDRWRRDWYRVWKVDQARCLFETRRTLAAARESVRVVVELR